MAAVASADCEQVGTKQGSDMARLWEAKLAAAVYVALAINNNAVLSTSPSLCFLS